MYIYKLLYIISDTVDIIIYVHVHVHANGNLAYHKMLITTFLITR